MQEYIDIVYERERQQDIRQARLNFQTASLLSRLFGPGGEEFDLMGEFDWLFTIEERREAKKARLLAVLEKK